jgi:hypothetical protein
MGQEAVTDGMERIQQRVDRVVRASIDRLGPVRKAREEMEVLRQRLHDLEASLIELEKQRAEAETASVPRPAKSRARSARKPGEAKASPGSGSGGAEPAAGVVTGTVPEE